METSLRHNANLLLVAGYSPFLRLGPGLRTLMTDSLPSPKLAKLMDEIVEKSGSRISFSDLRIFNIRFGEEKFRITAIGRSTPYAILATLLSHTRMPLTVIQQEWNATTDDILWVHTISRHIVGGKGDIVLLDGAPLLAWDNDGVHPFSRSILRSGDIRSYVNRVAPTSRWARDGSGYFKFIFNVKGQQVHAAFFDGAESLILLLVRASEERDEGTILRTSKNNKDWKR